MTRYRRTTIVDAIQWDGGELTNEVVEFVNATYGVTLLAVRYSPRGDRVLLLEANGAEHQVHPGCFIVRGTPGGTLVMVFSSEKFHEQFERVDP